MLIEEALLDGTLWNEDGREEYNLPHSIEKQS
jgi:hypothetical protein